MTKEYLIKLTPHDYYFFGGEETFNMGAKGVKNYMVRSNNLPQQTGVVGLLRHALYSEYFDRIGEGFGSEPLDIGAIKSISPLFLLNSNNEILIQSPLNTDKAGDTIPFNLQTEGVQSFVNGEWKKKAPIAPKYNAKNGLGEYWINIETKQKVKSEKIFKKKFHIGIDKSKRTLLDDKDAFYKQEYISLIDNFSMAFIATLDADIDISKLPTHLPFGGEKRTFQISYKELSNNDTYQCWSNVKEKVKILFNDFLGNSKGIILLSDAKVSDIAELYKLIDFGHIEKQPFRNILTPKSVTNFATLTKNKNSTDSRIKQDLQTLIKKGTILLVPNENKSKIEHLLSNASFETIGYNHYISNL